MVYNGVAYLGQPVHIGFPGTVVPALQGVQEQTPDRIIVVTVIFCHVALPVPRQSVPCVVNRSCKNTFTRYPCSPSAAAAGGPCKPCPHDNNVHLLPVCRRHRFQGLFVNRPFLFQRTFRNFASRMADMILCVCQTKIQNNDERYNFFHNLVA